MPSHVAAEFDSFVRARTPSLLRSAHVLTGDRQLAEDLVQNALARIYVAWPRLYESENAEAYTRKIMYNLQVTAWRRRRIAEVLTSTTADVKTPGTDHTDRTELRLALRDALQRLGPRQRAVLTLRFYEDLTEQETAELLDIAVGTVKSQTAKALNRLRTVAPELAEHYQGYAEEAMPVDLKDRAVATAKRQRVRNMAITAFAILLCIGAIGVLAIGRDRSPHPAQSPTPQPTSTAAPTAVTLPLQGSGDPQVLSGFLGVTITVPAWTGRDGRDCPAGRVRLDDHAQYHAPGGKPGLTVIISMSGDVDRDGVMDTVALLRCGPTGAGGFKAVAYRTQPYGGAGPLIGQVLQTGAGIGAIEDIQMVSDGVRLDVTDRLPIDGPGFVLHQARMYRWEGGKFVQNWGPVEFPRPGKAATLIISAKPVHLEPMDGVRYLGYLEITAANTGAADVPNGSVEISLPDGFQPAGTDWQGCTRATVNNAGARDDGDILITCPVKLAAGATYTVRRAVIAERLAAPELLGYATISQTPPYTLQTGSPQATSADIMITAAS